MDDTEPVPGVEHRERRTARTARLRAGRGHVDQPRLHGGRPDRLARKAALTSRWRFLPIADRIEIARFAITEHLLTTPEPPEVWSLVTLGRKRSRRTSNPKARYRGVHRAAQTSPRPVRSQCRARSAPPAPNPPPTWFPVPAPIEGLPVCLWCPPRPRISSRAWTAR